MNAIAKYSLHAATALVGTMLLAYCGGGGGNTVGGSNIGSGGSGNQAINSGADGARAATAVERTAYGIAPLGVKAAEIAATANSELGAVPATFIPVTVSCSSRLPVIGGNASTPNTATVLNDPLTGVTSATFNACRSGARQADGFASVTQTGGVSNFTLGSASGPLIVTEYADAASPVVTGVFRASGNFSFSQSPPSESLTIAGSIERYDFVRHTRDRYDLNGASMSIVTGASVIGADNYSDYTVTVNGASTRTAYVSDNSALVRYAESNGFNNFVVVYKTPAAGSAGQYDYLNLGGGFTVSTVPSGLCFDGTFMVATNADIRIVKATGTPIAGQLTLDAGTMATFAADGSVSVSLSGGSPSIYTQTDLLTLCSIG